jgi:hypothetical protein
VIIKPYEWNFKGKSGIGCGLQAIQIDKLKEYSGAADMFGDVKGGYEAPVKEPVAAGTGDMFKDTDGTDDDVPF